METNSGQPSDFLTTPEVAEILRLSNRQIERMVKRRQLPHYRFGRAIRFKRSDVLARVDFQNRVEQSESR